jgi:type II restriction enzyme
MPDGVELQLSAGEHNILQKAIIEGFLPLFGMGAEILYIGDTSDKFLFLKQDKLTEIGYFAVEHEELPDVIAYSREKNILFLIEAYHSTGQWSEIRVKKIRERLTDCKANIVYITAFESLESFRRKAAEIAWETEVWVADFPEHLIHFNGYKFLEIHK